MLPVGGWAQSPPPFDAAHANSYFEEARRVSEKDGGKLWGQTLYANSLLPQALRAARAERLKFPPERTLLLNVA